MNPFASRNIRPGAQAYLFPPGVSPESLIEKLAAHRWWGEIVGPHGSGKSTLLATLKPPLESAGRQVESFALRAEQVSLPQEPKQHPWGRRTLVVVDGYEQLTRWQRFRLRSACRRRRAGLLITTHRPQGLPTLWTTNPTPELAWTVVQRLQRETSEPLISKEDVHHYFARNRGDLRETLFSLYDVFEQRAADRAQPESPE
jgi:hypothetical protein